MSPLKIGASLLMTVLCTSCATTQYQPSIADESSGMEQVQPSARGHLVPAAQHIVRNGSNRDTKNGKVRNDLITMETKLNACMDLLHSHCATEVARLQAENVMLRQRPMPQPVALIPPAF